MFSIYTIAFNVVKNQFDFKEAVENFCFFAEEVVVAVNKSEDGTLEQFLKLQSTYDNLKIVEAHRPTDSDLQVYEVVRATNVNDPIAIGLPVYTNRYGRMLTSQELKQRGFRP